MSEINPIDEQKKLLDIMPDYSGPINDKEYRVGFGRRLGAALIDILILTVLVLLGMAVGGVFELISNVDWQALATDPQIAKEFQLDLVRTAYPISLAISVVYYSLEVILGASLGKLILGIQIANANRTKATVMQLLLRAVIKHIDYVFTLLLVITGVMYFSTLTTITSLIICIGFFFVLTEKRQAFHDMIAKTCVFFKDELIDNGKL